MSLLRESRRPLAALILGLCCSTAALAAQLKPQTVDDWNNYVKATDQQMNKRASGESPFLWLESRPNGLSRAHNGEIVVAPFEEHVPLHVHGGLIHHWVGASFIPGVHVNDILVILRDYPRYKEIYHPGVIDSALAPAAGTSASGVGADFFTVRLRNQSELAKTAIDATYTASCVQMDLKRAYIVAYTTRIQEIDHFGERSQRELPPDEGNGYLWRLYTTTRLVERDGGVYVEAEALALSRDIPFAARFIVDPIVRRVSREALTTSLEQTSHAVLAKQPKNLDKPVLVPAAAAVQVDSSH